MIRLLITHDEEGNPLPHLAPAKLQPWAESPEELDLADLFTASQDAIAAGDSQALADLLVPGQTVLADQIVADMDRYR